MPYPAPKVKYADLDPEMQKVLRDIIEAQPPVRMHRHQYAMTPEEFEECILRLIAHIDNGFARIEQTPNGNFKYVLHPGLSEALKQGVPEFA